MENLFELMTLTETDSGKVSLRLGIRLKVTGHEAVCPVTRSHSTYEAFEQDAQTLIGRLEEMKGKARSIFKTPSSAAGPQIGPDMPAEKIWEVLSTITDEATWVAAFNALEMTQREAVAEYVLTQCNIFSGKAAVFSRRYDSETALM
jgi:hypothetical protein